MTYPLIVLPLLLLTAGVCLTTVRHPHFGRRMRSSLVSAAVLVVLTALFDNSMIALDLFGYPDEHLSGIRIGLAPLEDFAYPIAAAFLVPAVWTLTAPKTDTREHTA